MSFKFHGNWCGPGWSDGKWQLSVKDGKLPAIDELDRVCKIHDQAYAKANGNGALQAQADKKFYETVNWNDGVKAVAAKIGIGIQGLIKQQYYKHSLIESTNKGNKVPNRSNLKLAADLSTKKGNA